MPVSIRVVGPLCLGVLLAVTGYCLRPGGREQGTPRALPAPPRPTTGVVHSEESASPTMLTPRLADIPHPPRDLESVESDSDGPYYLPHGPEDSSSSSSAAPDDSYAVPRDVLRPAVPHRHEL